MVTMFNPKPQLLRAVDKPENVSSQEIAKGRPVYIDGLPEGSSGPVAIADVEGLQDILDDLEQRVAALENAAG